MFHWHRSCILRTAITLTCILLLFSAWVGLSMRPFELSLLPELLVLWQRLQLRSVYVWFPAAGLCGLGWYLSSTSTASPPAALKADPSQQPGAQKAPFIMFFKPLSLCFQQGHRLSLAGPLSLCHLRHRCVFTSDSSRGGRKRRLPNPQPCTLEGGEHWETWNIWQL